MNLETYGTGERLVAAARLCSRLPIEHLVLLPVPTTKDNVYVTKTDTPLISTLCNGGEGSVFVGYGLPEEYKKDAESRGSVVLDLSCDETYQKENAILTAHGALGYILSSNKSAPPDVVFGIIGYGRIGSRLAEMLLFLGARVRIFTSKLSVARSLGECGVESVCVPRECCSYDFSGIDILINTAPKDMKEAFGGGKIPDGMRVIELASGKNFDGVAGVEYLPSLPEKMYPDSAGASYARAVERFIFREGTL